MKLIIDAGSTKMEWVLIDGNEVKTRFTTGGFNPNYSDSNCLTDMLAHQLPVVVPTEIQAIYYYGTGCGAEKNRSLVADAFRQHFVCAYVHVTHDLMAAAHAVLGNEKGIACILGTGANSCVYDGKQIVEKAVSLGYMVGDEGSGGHIGRQIVRSYFYGFMPKDLRDRFDNKYQLKVDDFVNQLYHNGQPNRYLASFAPFASENLNDPFIIELIRHCFDEYIEAFICRYEGCQTMKVCFVGSVAFHFKEVLKSCLDAHGLKMGEVLQNPMDGLVKFHTL